MGEIICLNEIRLKMELKNANAALIRARTMMSEGREIPEDIIPRLEAVIAELEQQLINLINRD